jgi:site-specific recombinase XerD
VLAGKVRENVSERAHTPKQQRPKPRFWNADQTLTFLDAAQNDRYYPLYVLAATTGMRQGELLGLHWPEVDLRRRRIAVVQSLVTPKKAPPVLEELKTWESRRSVGLVDMAVEAPSALDCDTGLVFRSQRNTFLNPSNIVNRSFKPLVARTGLPPIAFKDLRHTAASLLLWLRIHPKQVQEMLGHSDIRLTLNTYSHITLDMQDSVVSAMNLALNRSQKFAVIPAPCHPINARPTGFEPATGGLEVRDGRLSPSIAGSQKVSYLQVFPVSGSVVTYRRVPLYVGPVVVKIVVNFFSGSSQRVYEVEPRGSEPLTSATQKRRPPESDSC